MSLIARMPTPNNDVVSDVRIDVRTKHYSFSTISKLAQEQNDSGLGYRQYMQLYRAASASERPTILELGVDRGISTTVFLQACEERFGTLISVDIEDCSAISESRHWTFVQSDSTNIPSVLEAAPMLREGIDVLLIDSLHKRSHVEEEFYRWFPFVKPGGVIFFDDVDPFVYGKGQRKDRLSFEFDWQAIHDFVIEVFRANQIYVSLTIDYGSTGLAIMRKQAPIGTEANRAVRATYRTRQLWCQVWNLFRECRGLLFRRRRLAFPRTKR